jgi:hypothetical protein
MVIRNEVADGREAAAGRFSIGFGIDGLHFSEVCLV